MLRSWRSPNSQKVLLSCQIPFSQIWLITLVYGSPVHLLGEIERKKTILHASVKRAEQAPVVNDARFMDVVVRNETGR